MSFSQFYQDGGVFMHAITVCALVSAVSLFRTLRAGPAPRLDRMSRGMVTGALGLGLLGTLMGFIEVAGAIQTVPQEMWPAAIARGGAIAMYPLVYALLLGVPLQLANTVVATRKRVAGPS